MVFWIADCPGDFIGYLTQLTSFYQRHKELYSLETEIYEAEIGNWRALLVERRKERISLVTKYRI